LELGQAAIDLARELMERHQELGIEIVGFVDADPLAGQRLPANMKIVGAIEDIPAIVSGRQVDRVVLSLADARGRLPMDKLLDMKLQGVSFDHLASVYEQYTGKIALENLEAELADLFLGVSRDAGAACGQARERCDRRNGWVDSGVSSDGGGVGARSTDLARARVVPPDTGWAEWTPFTLYKFRSMRADAEAETGPVWAQPGDSRATPFGRFIRLTRLDELPQLWNVLIGEMSLVGTAP
jgi:hypothetical protein